MKPELMIETTVTETRPRSLSPGPTFPLRHDRDKALDAPCHPQEKYLGDSKRQTQEDKERTSVTHDKSTSDDIGNSADKTLVVKSCTVLCRAVHSVLWATSCPLGSPL